MGFSITISFEEPVKDSQIIFKKQIGPSGIVLSRWGDFSRRSVRRARRQNNSLGVRYASLKHVLAVSAETTLTRLRTG
jgi:hypothetical protein